MLADRLVSLAAAHGSMMQGGWGADIQQCAFKQRHNVTANVPATEGWRVCLCVRACVSTQLRVKEPSAILTCPITQHHRAPHLLESAGERVERLELAGGREQRVITPLITVVYGSQTLQPFKWYGKHLAGRLRAAGWCALLSDEAARRKGLKHSSKLLIKYLAVVLSNPGVIR